jgi:RES domain-containing protein
MRVWRITKNKYATKAFSGEGGLRSPGRWHHVGHRIVYTSQSLSLAAIETWVHIAPRNRLPDHVQVSADIPDSIPIHDIDESALPQGWNSVFTPILVLRDIGTRWLESRISAVARVPAATTPGEFNYSLNPTHGDFGMISSGEPQPFTFDPRMWTSAAGKVD